MVAYFITSIRLIALLAYQFEYDKHSLKLERLQADVQPDAAIRPNRTICHLLGNDTRECELERQHHHYIDSSHRYMKLLGNPYVKIRFSTQVALALTLGCCFLSYICPLIIYNFIVDTKWSLVNLLLDEANEFKRCAATVEHETQFMLKLSSNYIKTVVQLALIELHWASHWSGQQALSLSVLSFEQLFREDCELTRLFLDHELVARELKRLAASRQSHPINRTSAEWRQTLVTKFLKGSLSNIVYSFFLDWTFIYFIHLFSPIELEFQTLMDCFMVIELGLYCELSVLAVCYHLFMFLTECANQTRYIRHITGKINALIVTNERQVGIKVLQTNNGNQLDERQYREINLRILQAFLEYRVFRAQLSSFSSSWSILLPVGLLIMLVTPIFARLYAPYLVGKQSKTLCSLFSLNTTIFSDLLLVPICFFYYQGQRLYKALSSLLAHTIELDQQVRARFGGRGIYMANTICMIRRELDEPEQMMGHFLTEVPGFKATFPKLLGIHFYCGLMNLALYCEIDAWKNLLGARFDDPLLIY